jgi:hypothetical protein
MDKPLLVDADSAVKESTEKQKKPYRGGLTGPGPGRTKGIPNKATTDFRQAVTNLLNHTQDQMIGWLQEVADRDPGRALDLMAKLAEYAAPKLSRTEVTGPGGGALQVAAVDLRGLSEGELGQMEQLLVKAAPSPTLEQAIDVPSRVVAGK